MPSEKVVGKPLVISMDRMYPRTESWIMKRKRGRWRGRGNRLWWSSEQTGIPILSSDSRVPTRASTSGIDTIDTLLSRRDTYTLNRPRIDGSPCVDVFVVEPSRASLCNQHHHERKKKKREIVQSNRESMTAHAVNSWLLEFSKHTRAILFASQLSFSSRVKFHYTS